MKKLEELGISPAPWKCTTYRSHAYGLLGEVKSLSGFKMVVDAKAPDANMMGASPELYDALYDVVAYCEATHLVPSERFKKVLDKAKGAIAKAAGEALK